MDKPAEDDFYQLLRDEVISIADDLSCDSFDGDPGLDVTFNGVLESNYPWLYMRLRTDGILGLGDLERIKSRIESFTFHHKKSSLQSISLAGVGAGELLILIKMVYNPDYVPGEIE